MDKNIHKNVDELIKKKEDIYNELFKLLKTKKKLMSISNSDNTNIIIDEKSVKSKKLNSGSYQSMRKISVDRSFTYYIRYAPENVILSMGYID